MPGRTPTVQSIHFTLTHVSMPSDVSIDVGDDESIDWTHAGVLEETTVADLRESLQAFIDAADGVGDEGGPYLTVPISILTLTPGVVLLTSILVKVDTPPMVVDPDPASGNISIDEGTTQHFEVTVEEYDGQELDFTWYVGEEEVTDDPMPTTGFDFTPSEDEVWDRSLEIGVMVTDGSFTDMWFWIVHVNETTPVPNVPPVVDTFEPNFERITIDENQSISFSVGARDPDDSPLPLVYRWFIDDQEDNSTDAATYTIVTDYGWACE